MRSFQNDLVEVETVILGHKEAVQDLRSSMLKSKRPGVWIEQNTQLALATTRKEEIARFHKAKKDNEFAKMLRSRTLGPEHLETQTQLRRKIRVCVFSYLNVRLTSLSGDAHSYPPVGRLYQSFEKEAEPG